MHRGLKHLFQVYEIDSNLEVMYDRLTMSWNSSSAFGRSECPDMAKKRLIFRSLARLWKAKQKKMRAINASASRSAPANGK